VKAHTNRDRRFCSAIAVLDGSLALNEVTPKALDTIETGGFAVSHPGQFAVAEVRDAERRPLLTLISLYGILDQDADHLFSEATLHRAISDLTVLFQQRHRERILLAGDLNIFWQWDKSSIDGDWAPRFNTVFDRLGAYGMDLIGPHGERPLDRCPCQRGADCRHVRTYALDGQPANLPLQLDYMFATKSLEVTECRVISDEADWKYSDHLPVAVNLRLPD
jgi:exonuclease III